MTKQPWMLSLTTAGALLLASLLPAQETGNSASTEPMSIVLQTNNADTNNPSTNAATEPAEEQDSGNWTAPKQVVLMGQNAEIKAGETVDEVVVIGGSAKVHGKVRKAAVVIFGNLEIDGEVGDAAVAVMGNIRIRPGAVIHRDAVAVMGNLSVAEGATVLHDTVSVGGKLDISPGAVVRGEKVSVGGLLPFPKFEWLGSWFKECVLKCRPLAPQVGWIWIIAGVFFLLRLFVAAVFPRPVQACVETLTRRPATTFFMGLLTKLLAPIVILILIATVVGIVILPFVWVALFLGALVGKIAIAEGIGFQIGRHFGGGLKNPLIAFLIGTVIITLLYMVPVLGLLTFLVISVWGLGCAVTAAFGSLRREMPDKPVSPPPAGAPPIVMPAVPPVHTSVPPPPTAGFASAGTLAHQEPPPAILTGEPPQFGSAPAQTAPAMGIAPPPVCPPAWSFPRAGFWERTAAAFLDLIVIGILVGIAHGPLRFLFHLIGNTTLGFFIALAYFALLWTWKGTTIGGIVLKLKVVRSDNGPLTFAVALVRALAAALSVIIFFLGFLWIAWDKDKQGWHDKIAGTDVIRLPRSTPLVCL